MVKTAEELAEKKRAAKVRKEQEKLLKKNSKQAEHAARLVTRMGGDMSKIAASVGLPVADAAQLFIKASVGDAAAKVVLHKAKLQRRKEARIQKTVEKGSLSIEEAVALHERAEVHDDQEAIEQIREIQQRASCGRKGGTKSEDLRRIAGESAGTKTKE